MLALASLLLTLTFFVWLASRALPRIDRLLALLESTRKPATAAVREPMPLDLVGWTKNWSDQWAQDAAMKTVEEAYQRTGSWDGARATLPFLASNLDGES